MEELTLTHMRGKDHNSFVCSRQEWISYKKKYLELRKQSAKAAKRLLSGVGSESRTPPNGQNPGKKNPERVRRADQDEATVAVKRGKISSDEKQSNAAEDNSQTDEVDHNEETQPVEEEKIPEFDKGCIIKLESTRGLVKADKVRSVNLLITELLYSS